MNKTKPRERVLAGLRHEETDRVPLDLGGLNTSMMVETYERLKAFIGKSGLGTKVRSKTWQVVDIDEPILERFQIDTRYLFPNIAPVQKQAQTGGLRGASPQQEPVEDGFIDEWGVKRKLIMHYFEIAEHPLKEAERLDDLESYPWPNPHEFLILNGLRDRARHLREYTDYALIGTVGGGNIFEQSWYLRGLSEILMDLMINKEFVHALFSKLLEIRKKTIKLYLTEVGEYLDVFQVGDDLATQNGLMISPALYREMIKPYQEELFRFIKELTQAKLYYHSCGAIIPLIGDLIEIGVDALNPIQVSAEGMNTADLKSRYGKEICFWGAIDSQGILPFGTTGEVEKEVRKRIRDLGPGGGYILAGVHNLQPDIPPENIVCMYDSGAKFGKYPIKC